ncbi:MAG: nitroreductase family protein [Planctomycetota bacterium]
MSEPDFIPYQAPVRPPEEMQRRGEELFAEMEARRSVRDFSDRPVDRALIETAIRIASTAPSGAHRQPWRFVAVSDPGKKREIRIAAEAEERESYEHRMSDEWREALAPFGTTWQKPFLETVPWIVVVFEEIYRLDTEAQKEKNYYVKESVGIACGFFIAALHHMGLATLTHTPSPMGFLGDLLERPKNERAFILFPIGFPADNAEVPNIQRKSLEAVSQWL